MFGDQTKPDSTITTVLPVSSTPEPINWCDQGACNTPVDQGPCGSCWAFASTAAMESHHFIQDQQLLKLSEQELVDCVTGSNGCHGGSRTYAMQYLETHG